MKKLIWIAVLGIMSFACENTGRRSASERDQGATEENRQPVPPAEEDTTRMDTSSMQQQERDTL